MTFDQFVKAHNGKEIDFDGTSGVQCVDLIKAYMNEVLGMPASSIGRLGNAYQFWTATRHPLRDAVDKVAYKKGMVFQKGDIAVWNRNMGGGYGHVALCTGERTGSWFATYDQNWNGKAMHRVQHSYSNLYGVLRPKAQYQSRIRGSSSDVDDIIDIAVDQPNKIADLIEEAEDHVGEGSTWTCNKVGIATNSAWSAAFIVACARQVEGLINKVIPNTTSCSAFVRTGVNNGYGKWHKGPRLGQVPTPFPGDVVAFAYSMYNGIDDYYTDHVGLIKEVSSGFIYTIEGDSSGKVAYKAYPITATFIQGYYRPNWDKVGSSVTYLITNGLDGPLYDEVYTREDAILREVGYMNTSYKPSITATNINLSIINYTTITAGIFNSQLSVQAQSVYSGAIIDGLPQNARIIVQYLMDKGISLAGSVGVIANIYYESGFRPDLIEYGYTINSGGVGICQWTNTPRTSSKGRRTNMLKAVGSDWRTDLTGQLDYLWKELTSSYKGVLANLRRVTNNEAGARNAADYFVRHFEIPANLNEQSRRRQNKASEYWNICAPQLLS